MKLSLCVLAFLVAQVRSGTYCNNKTTKAGEVCYLQRAILVTV